MGFFNIWACDAVGCGEQIVCKGDMGCPDDKLGWASYRVSKSVGNGPSKAFSYVLCPGCAQTDVLAFGGLVPGSNAAPPQPKGCHE